jgi:N utilization substance protein B
LAPEFPPEHLSPIDRNILRIALYEMRQGVVPLKVAISEAVNLAKAFGSESSFRFVNGVLGAAARQ